MRMKRLFTQEAFIILSLTFIALALNGFVWIMKVSNTPPGRDFIPIHNSIADYPYYVNIIRQGIEGEKFVYDRYAVEPHDGTVLHYSYLVLGWIGGVTGIHDANTVYHISRYILALCMAMATYWLIETVVREKWIRILAFFFTLFSASFPRFLWENGHITTTWFMTWWSELDPILRVAFVPHFLIGHTMMIVSLVSLVHYEKKPDRIWLIRGAVSAWVGAFVFPVSYILLVMVLPLYALLARNKRWMVGMLVVLLAGGFGAFVVYQTANAFPWNQAKQLETIMYAVPVTEYLLALGPVVLLAVIGLIVQHTKRETWLFVIWIATSLVMIPLSKMMPYSPIAFIREHPVSNIRFLQTALWVPLGILGAYGIRAIWSKWGKWTVLAILIIYSALTFAGYPASINEQIHTMYFSFDYTYPKKGYIDAIKSLATVTNPRQAVLSLWLGGMTVPMYVDRTSYLGHLIITPQIDLKQKLAWQFFHGDMNQCDAYKLLMANHIGAVLYSFDEQNAGTAVQFYPFLQPWNRYGDTEVFTVVNTPPVGCQ